MSKPLGFGSPLLRDLEKKYGAKQSTKTVPIRENKDVAEFLEHKREAEKKTAEEKLVFK